MCSLKVRFSQSPERRGVLNYALSVKVLSATSMPTKIFVYHQSPSGVNGNTFAEFDHVATPVDFQEIPEDAASNTVPWYRTDNVVVWFRNVSDLNLAKQMFVDDIRVLQKNYDVLTSKENFARQSDIEFTDTGVHEESVPEEEGSIEQDIAAMKTEIDRKISKDALDGVAFETNDAAGIREAVKIMGVALGAKIAKSIALIFGLCSLYAHGAGFSGAPYAQLDLDENPVVVTNVTFDGLAFAARNFTTNNLAALDENGNPTDSGVAKSYVENLVFAQYYPDGSVKSVAEFTSDIKYMLTSNATERTAMVKPFCVTDTAGNDNSNLSGRVVIPPFVDDDGNGYISDDGTRYKVVGVSETFPSGENSNLTTIIAPNTVTTIGDFAFWGCVALTNLSLPAATTIGGSAFIGCVALTNLSLPAATTIGDYAFFGCDALSTLALPAATTIGEKAFYSCVALTNLSLPAATTIGGSAFSFCDALTTVSLPAATTIGVSAFYFCTSLTSVSLPAATTIGSYAFDSCTSLTTLALPAATTIGYSVFNSCTSLTSVSLPAVTTIRGGAFSSCTSLAYVDFGDTPRSSVPSLGNNAFTGVTTSCKIIVPDDDDQYDAWIAADGWKDLPQEFLRHSEWEYARKYDVDKKADKPVTFTAGNLAKFDSDGNLIDTEISTDEIVTESEFEPVANREFLMISSDRSVALAKDAVESAYLAETSHNATNAGNTCYGFSLNLKSYLEELASSEASEISITKVRLQSITIRLRNLTNLAKLAVKETGTSDVLALSDPLQLRNVTGGLNFTFLFSDGVVLPADRRYDFYVVDASSGAVLTGSRMGTISTTKITGLELLNNDGTRSSYNGAWGGGITADCIGLASIRIATETDLSGLQEKLTFDTAPKANSQNPVTSDGIKTAIDSSNLKTGSTSGIRLDNSTASGLTLFFRPRAFGMHAGDKIHSIILHTSSSTSNTSSPVYARLVKYTASSQTYVALSEATQIQTRDVDVEFTFESEPAVDSADQYYRLELTTSTSTDPGANPINASLRVYYEQDGVRKPDCYFFNSLTVPVMSVKYRGAGNPVILNTDNCIGSGVTTYHTGSTLNIQGQFTVLTNGTVTVQSWDQIRLASGQTLPEFIAGAIVASSGNVHYNATDYDPASTNPVTVEALYMDATSISNAVKTLPGAQGASGVSAIGYYSLPVETPE